MLIQSSFNDIICTYLIFLEGIHFSRDAIRKSTHQSIHQFCAENVYMPIAAIQTHDVQICTYFSTLAQVYFSAKIRAVIGVAHWAQSTRISI